MKTLHEISIKLAGNYIKAATEKIKALASDRGANLATIRKRSAGVKKAKGHLYVASLRGKNGLSKKAFDLLTRYEHQINVQAHKDTYYNEVRAMRDMVRYVDPTGVKEEYLEFLVKTYAKGQWSLLDYQRLRTNLEKFHQLKPQLAPGERDISRYNNIEEIDEIVENQLVKPSNKYLVKMKKIQGTNILIDEPEFKAIRLFKHDAVKYYCAGTRWCLTDTDQFHMYTRHDAHLIIIIAKMAGQFRKFGWHMDTGIIVDEQDDRITAKEFTRLRNLPQFHAIEKYLIDNTKPNAILKYITSSGLKELKSAEPKLALEPESAYDYAIHIEKPFPTGERVLAGHAGYALNYNIRFKTRIGMKAISKNPMTAFTWAHDVLHKRFPDGEKAILEDPQLALNYARKIIAGPWPAAEPMFAKDPTYSIPYAKFIGARFPAGEKELALYAGDSLSYAKIIKGRFPAGERVISQDGEAAVDYARYIIKGRWKAGEAAISQNNEYVLDYIMDVLKHPWPEAENTILRSDYYSKAYAHWLWFNGFPMDNFAKKIKEKHNINFSDYAEL